MSKRDNTIKVGKTPDTSFRITGPERRRINLPFLGAAMSVLLAASFAAPRAMALPPPSDLLQVLETLLGLQETLDEQSNHAQRGRVALQPEGASDSFVLLGPESASSATLIEDRVYSGSVTLIKSGLSGDKDPVLYCSIGDETEGGTVLAHAVIATVSDANPIVTTPFNCHSLWLWVADDDDDSYLLPYAMEYRVTEAAVELDSLVD